MVIPELGQIHRHATKLPVINGEQMKRPVPVERDRFRDWVSGYNASRDVLDTIRERFNRKGKPEVKIASQVDGLD